MSVRRAWSIRCANSRDVANALELSNAAAERGTANLATAPESLDDWTIAWRTTHERHPWLVAHTEERRVIGFAKAAPHRTRGAYAWTAECSVYVDPSWHRQGLGTELSQTLIEILRAQGYITLIAGIVVGHAPSELLHERLGYVKVGTFPRAGYKNGAWHDVGYWSLALSEPNGEPGAVRRVVDVYSGGVLPAR